MIHVLWSIFQGEFNGDIYMIVHHHHGDPGHPIHQHHGGGDHRSDDQKRFLHDTCFMGNFSRGIQW